MDVTQPRRTKKRQLAVEERQRAVRACAECRRLKEKCEGGMPCKRCRHLKRSCEFSPTARGGDMGSMLNELKDRAQWMGSILKHHFPELGLDSESLRQACNTLTHATAKPIHDADAPEPTELTLVPNESPGIEDENCTLEDVDGQTVHYSGEFSHWNYSMHLKRNIDELMKKSNTPVVENVAKLPDFIRVGEADPGSTSIADIVALLPPRPVATFLVKVFMRHATSLYYFVEPKWLEAKISSIYNTSTSLSSRDVTAACVVLMVFAVGTQYVHLETPQEKGKRQSNVVTHGGTQGNWQHDIGSAFYRQVVRLVSEIIHAGSLLSVEVFLLLGLYALPIDASGLSYIYLNLAIKVGIQNGMHRSIVRSDIDTNTKEIRRRIWWTAYCMERKIGIYHGRPASIARADIDADMPKDLDGDAYWAAGLVESITLIGEGEAFLAEISRLRTCPRKEVGPTLSRIKSMKIALRKRRPPPSSVKSHHASSRAEMHSQLENCLLHMFIGRPFILAHRQVRPTNTAGTKTTDLRKKTSRAQLQWDLLVQDCIAAAKEVIRICYTLQTGPMGLAKSSYTEYSSCRASLLVLIAYSICYRTNEFSDTLEQGLDAIKEMASVGESARSEVNLLETLQAALRRLHVFDNVPTEAPPGAPEDASHEGYEGFLNWYNKLTRPYQSGNNNSDAAPNAPGADLRQPFSSAELTTIDELTGSTSTDSFMDDYPFDFDLLNTNGNVAFFTPDFNEQGNPERELFENLLWQPQ